MGEKSGSRVFGVQAESAVKRAEAERDATTAKNDYTESPSD